jgi:hypothetical protein
MLSTQLHEAVKSGYVDLTDRRFMEIHRGENLGAEEKALATALVKMGKAFIADPNSVATESTIAEMIYRGLRRVSPAHAASFGEYMQSRARPGRFIVPEEVEKYLKIKRVKGRTTTGWKIEAKLDFASQALAFQALAKALKWHDLPTRTASRKGSPDEFMLMAPLPVKDKGAWYWQFKHRATRNYVFLNAEKGTMYIPSTGKPFMMGQFGDKP